MVMSSSAIPPRRLLTPTHCSDLPATVMIQRIQTLYLLLSTILCVGCMSSGIGHFFTKDGEAVADMYNLWLSYEDGRFSLYPWALFAILLVVSTLSFLGIFLFTRRALQMRLCTFCIILLAAWYVVYAALAYNFCHAEDILFRTQMPVVLPVLAIVFMYLAFKGIMKDEMLVRSLDRLR